MVSFRNLFLSENQRQVEAEARNIGLAHSIRDLITGSNHEIHVDSYQKKKAVKALQKAKPAEVNDLINILKAMPDPTVVEFKEVHSREASRHHPAPTPVESKEPKEPQPTAPPPSSGDTPTTPPASPDSKETTTTPGESEGEEEVEIVKAPSSWWAVSFASLKASLISGSAVGEPSITTTTTTVTTITMTAEEVKKAAAEAEAAEAAEAEAKSAAVAEVEKAKAAEAEKAKAVESDAGAGPETEKAVASAEIAKEKKDKGNETTTTVASKSIGTVTSSTTVADTKTTADKTTLVSTLNSIKQQIVALTKTPPINVISAYTYWWGYEIYVPHKCMNKLQRVTNTSQIFFGFLSGAVAGMPGLAALVPLSRIISAWVGFQWAIILAEDLGKGVVLSATWVLPVALAPRSWDHPGTE